MPAFLGGFSTYLGIWKDSDGATQCFQTVDGNVLDLPRPLFKASNLIPILSA